MHLFQKIFFLIFVFVSTIFGTVISGFAGFMVPTGTNIYSMVPSVAPLSGDSKDGTMPFGLGEAALGGPILDLVVELPEYNAPVDIYLALSTNLYPGSIFVFDEFNNVSLLSGTSIPIWREGIQSGVGDVILHDIPISSLPPGTTVDFYLLVSPSGDTTFSAFDLWTTRLVIQGQGAPEGGGGGGMSSSSSNGTSGVYKYDFETGTDGWDLGEAWQRTTLSGGGYGLVSTAEGTATAKEAQGKITYVRYRFSVETLGNGLDASIFSSQGQNTLEIGPRGVCYFQFPSPDGSEIEHCIYGHYPILPQQFYTIEMYIGDTSIDIFINGEAVVGTDLETPIPEDRTFALVAYGSAPDQRITVDDVEIRVGEAVQPPAKARSPFSWQPGPDVGPFVNGVALQPFTLSGHQSITLSGGRYMAYGDITLKDNASLIVEKDAILYTSDVYLRDNASLTVNGAYLYPTGDVITEDTTPAGASTPDMLGAVYAEDNATVTIHKAKVGLHFMDTMGQSHLEIKDSRFYTPGGGMVTPYGSATIQVENTTLGAISLIIPEGATFKAQGLKPGHFDNLNLVQDMDISGVQYNLILKNVDLVPDTLTTGHASDASERGWELGVAEGAHVELTDSELRKLSFQITGSGQPLTFRNLVVGQPMNATVGPVTLKNTTIRGQWGFDIRGNRQVTIEDSDGIWPLPYDTSKVTIKNTRVNEFDPRQYTGTISFENVRWHGPGEIIMDCNFTMQGTIDMQVPTLSWQDSTVTREYLIRVRDASGSPSAGVTLTLTRGSETVTAITDAQGEARVNLKFDDSNYDQAWTLTTSQGKSQEITFYTSTPVTISP